jgi:pantoate--beta-alanine ligase
VTARLGLAPFGTRADLTGWREAAPGRVAVVMTMGALHAGHVALLRAARPGCDRLLVTIFVNPLQFGPAEDLARYPRTMAADLEVCRAEGADAVFAPTVAEMYPEPAMVTVDPGPAGEVLEGAARPGHFRGVLTVVLKLLQLTAADAAYFGEKDYQQLTLIRRMVADLNLPVEVGAVPTVRETDGLALSSRNRFLTPTDRRSALVLSRALRAGAAAAGAGAEAVMAAARAEFAGTPEVVPDYLELTDASLGPAPAVGAGRLLVAAKVGGIRLIDNVPVDLGRAPIDRDAPRGH